MPVRKHGHSRSRPGCKPSPEYVTWSVMKQRCQNPNDPFYANYGGRGIKVCARWQSFELFLVDMGPRSQGTSIDRFPNVDGDYEPGNCRWASDTEQQRNRGNAKLSWDDVVKIREEASKGRSQSSLGREFGVGQPMISLIVNNKVWRENDAR